MREIEPTVIEEIQPTKMFLPEVAITPTIEQRLKVVEVKQDTVSEEKQNSIVPEVKVEKQKTAKALFQEVKTVEKEKQEEVVPVTEAISYEEDEEEEEEENETEEVHEPEPGKSWHKTIEKKFRF